MAQLKTNALTTLQRAKDFMGISGDRYDTVITMLINHVTDFMESFCGRIFKSATYTSEAHDGKGTKMLVAKYFPITAFTSLQYRDSDDPSDETWNTFGTDQYFWYDDGRIVHATAKFREVPKKYRMTYTAGYLIDFANENNASLHTLPMELELICLRLIAAIFNSRKAEGIETQRVGDISIKIKSEAFQNKEILETLGKYKLVTI